MEITNKKISNAENDNHDSNDTYEILYLTKEKSHTTPEKVNQNQQSKVRLTPLLTFLLPTHAKNNNAIHSFPSISFDL